MDNNNTSKINHNFNQSSNSFFKETINKFRQSEEDFQMISKNSINYSNQFIKIEDWENISKILKENSNYNSIILSGINIEESGLKILGDILKNNSNVTNLKLEWNYLNETLSEFENFCECLSTSNLQNLFLNNNKINNAHCQAIGKLLRDSMSLMNIDLRWNEIGNEGVKKIISSLEKNSALIELTLIGNKIDEEFLRQISDCLNKNKMRISNHLFNQNDNNLTKSKSNFYSSKNLKKSFTSQSLEIEKDRENLNFIRDNENVPLKFLEKEKELSEEFKARYDVQLIVNAKLEKRNKELECLIELERNKVTNAKDNFEKDLEDERNLRIKYEDQILTLKDELMQFKVEKSKIENDYDNKIVYIQNENNCLQNENKLLKDKLDRLTSLYEQKINLIEEENRKNINYLNFSNNELTIEIEKIKRDLNEELRLNFKEFEKKYKQLDENFRNLKLVKDEIERNYLQLKKENLDYKLEFEIKLKEHESIWLEKEINKNESLVNNYENRIKILEMIKKEMTDKIDNLHEEINSLKKLSSVEQISYENKINLLNIEKVNLTKNNFVMNSDQSKFSTEIMSMNGIITKLQNQNSDLNRIIEESNIKNKIQYDKLENEKNYEKSKYDKEKKNNLVKIEEFENNIKYLKIKIAKFETEDVKFAESLKISIFKLIDNY